MYTNSKLTKSIRLALIAGAASSAMLATSTFAQETEEQGKSVERIEVTGSSIKRTDMEGALPVQVIDRVQIDRSGVASVGELIQNLPAMQGFTTSSDSVGGSGGGIATASLHDLGEDYTLVLLNGRRLAPRGSGSTIDLNSIPLSAIERVEVLTDGASALYGSDAIAGVVNFILKKDVQETTISGRYSRPQEDGGKGWNGSITTGFGDLDSDGFNIMLSYSHDRQDQLAAKDREFAKTGIISFEHGGRDLYFFNGSPNAIPGNAEFLFKPGTVFDPANEQDGFEYGYNQDGTLNYVDFNPYRIENGQCAENNSAIGGWCWFDYTTTLEIFPESDRDSFYTNANFKLTDDMTGFIEASYSDYSMTTRIAPYPSGGVLVPIDSPLYDEYMEPYLPEGLTNDDVSLGIGVWRALSADNRTTEWNTKSTHIVAGLEGIIGDEIDYSGAFTYSKNDTDQNYPAGWLYQAPFGGAIASGAIDIFAPAGEVTPEEVDAAGIVYRGNWSNSSTEMKAVDFKASMPVFSLAGGEAYLGAGFDYRDYHYVETLAPANENAELLFLTADTPYDLQREAYGVFAELFMPVIDDLEVTAALRYDSVGAVDDKLNNVEVNDSENDTTYKISARYQFNDDILLRASYGTGFKAPSMLAIARPRSEFGVTGGNYPCPFSAGDPYAEWCKPGNQQYNVYNQGNPDLAPETSEQMTLGFVYAPSQQFSFGLDYWSVEMEDLVTSVTEAQIFASPDRYRDLFTFKTNALTGQDELAIILASVNVGKSENSGIDWNTTVRNELSFGELSTTFSGTYMIESQYTRPGTTDDWITSMGRFGDNNAVTFRTVAKLTSTLTHGDFAHTLTLNYKSGYDDQFQDKAGCAVTEVDAFGDCAEVMLRVSSYTKVDYISEYHVMEGLKVGFGINNLFDRAPDLSLRSGGAGHQVGFDPRYTDAFGRTFYLTADYTF